MLTNCLIADNAVGFGGEGTLVNCTVVSNYFRGVGAGATLKNCIVYFNSAYYNGASNVTVLPFTNPQNDLLYYSCTFPMPTNGTASMPTNGPGNITNPPVFVDFAGGNFRLQTNSPCINVGNNSYVGSSTDLDGRPRIVGGTVDMGAYEFQGPGLGEFIGWLQQYGLPTDGSVDYADLDGTSFNVYQDWIAGLDPTNALSVLAMLPPVPTNNPAGLVVGWESVSNRTYFLQSSTNLGTQPTFSTIQSNIVGQSDTTTFMDTNAVGNGPYFYRVGVQQ